MIPLTAVCFGVASETGVTTELLTDALAISSSSSSGSGATLTGFRDDLGDANYRKKFLKKSSRRSFRSVLEESTMYP